ncbi:MAG: hypothetical protein E6371_07590 [Terrisporobacter othiniensis]|uniref:hypothetical protein n=1 Tax=Terrisporobacter othiniensis TaxID=1577792 RepID=UPI00290DC3F0|nr:hypothetical protein [Terrisporobacter othiniensis]MDU6984263.1 hypothetical protein [Terrisporobacter othiniensis]
MPDDNYIAHDLTIMYLKNNFDVTLSPKELVQKYKETYKMFKDELKQPVAKVKTLDRRDLGL